MLPGRTWIESMEDVAFGFWKEPGYLKTKLMVIGKYGKVLTRQNYGNKVSCTFNMSVLRVAFTVHNLSTCRRWEWLWSSHWAWLGTESVKRCCCLRLEGNCNIKYSLKLKRSIVSARGQKFPFSFARRAGRKMFLSTTFKCRNFFTCTEQSFRQKSLMRVLPYFTNLHWYLYSKKSAL